MVRMVVHDFGNQAGSTYVEELIPRGRASAGNLDGFAIRTSNTITITDKETPSVSEPGRGRPLREKGTRTQFR
jgi:hypothetical protein